MQNLSKSILVITAILSLLLNIFLIVRFSVNLSTVIYTDSSEWFDDIKQKHIGKPDCRTRSDISDRDIGNISDIDVPFPNHTFYVDNLKKNMKKINVSLTTLGKPLSERVSVLCLVMTQPKNLRTKAAAVKNTWGRRCNKLLFISSVPDRELPALGFNTTEGKPEASLGPCQTSMAGFVFVKVLNPFHSFHWSFSIPPENITGFLMFSGVTERDQWHEMG